MIRSLRLDARTALIEAAAELLAREPRTRLAEIAARAGVARATLHRHFASRDDLIDTLRVEAHASVVAALDSVDFEHADAREALASTFSALVPIGPRLRFLYFDHDEEGGAFGLIEDGRLQQVGRVAKALRADGWVASDVPDGWVESLIEQLVYTSWSAVQMGVVLPATVGQIAAKAMIDGSAPADVSVDIQSFRPLAAARGEPKALGLVEGGARGARRDRLVDAVVDVLAARPRATLAEVAAGAGIGVSTLQRHFASRAGMIRAVAERAFDLTDRATVGLEREARSGAESLYQTIHACAPSALHSYVISMEAWLLTVPELQQRYVAQRDGLAECVAWARYDGTLGADVHASWLVSWVECLIYAAARTAVETDVPLERTTELASRTLFAGVGPRKGAGS